SKCRELGDDVLAEVVPGGLPVAGLLTLSAPGDTAGEHLEEPVAAHELSRFPGQCTSDLTNVCRILAAADFTSHAFQHLGVGTASPAVLVPTRVRILHRSGAFPAPPG